MPVIATPTAARILSRDEVRRWMRDFPPGLIPKTGVINALLDGVEFSDEDVEAGLMGAVDRYNCMTPLTGVTLDSIPRTLLLYGAVAHLLWSESFRQLRNQATVSDAEVPQIGIDDKTNLYAGACDRLWAKFDELARAVKTERNMEQMSGGLPSGYAYTGRGVYGAGLGFGGWGPYGV